MDQSKKIGTDTNYYYTFVTEKAVFHAQSKQGGAILEHFAFVALGGGRGSFDELVSDCEGVIMWDKAREDLNEAAEVGLILVYNKVLFRPKK
jgi:hypothetical protein